MKTAPEDGAGAEKKTAASVCTAEAQVGRTSRKAKVPARTAGSVVAPVITVVGRLRVYGGEPDDAAAAMFFEFPAVPGREAAPL